MAKVIKKRPDKKTHAEGDIKDTVKDIKERIGKRQQTFVYMLIGFLFVVTSVAAFFIYTKTTLNTALELESEAYNLYYGDYLKQPISDDERYRKALDLFKKSYAAKKRAHVLLYIANCQYELGNYDEAIKTLTDLNNQFSEPQIISLSYYKMAMAYMRKGEKDSALNALKNIYTIKGSTINDVALLESGRILESMGKTEEAKERYRDLINKFPKSALLDEAKKRLGDKQS